MYYKSAVPMYCQRTQNGHPSDTGNKKLSIMTTNIKESKKERIEKIQHDMAVLYSIRKSLQTLKSTSPNHLLDEVKETLADLEVSLDEAHGSPQPDLSFIS